MQDHKAAMLLQLEPFPVKTPLGDGYAIMLQVDGHDYWWTIALSNGAIVTFTQDRIRMAESYTHRRGVSDKRMKKVINRNNL